MPAFIGLFTLPWLILNIAVGTNPPQQNTNPTAEISSGTVSRGALAGALGGGFAAFFPVVTGGVGGFLAGHATAINDSRTFLISQGASKLIYYTGGLLLFFVPGLEIRRGGGAWMINGLMAYSGSYQYLSALLAAAVSGSAALLLILPLSRLVLRLIGLVGFRLISIIALSFSVMIVIAVNGIPGAGIMVVAAGIGLLPVLFGTRRMNCLGVIMLPLACNMSGAGVLIAHKIGLI
jgi:putative membrane protein